MLFKIEKVATAYMYIACSYVQLPPYKTIADLFVYNKLYVYMEMYNERGVLRMLRIHRVYREPS